MSVLCFGVVMAMLCVASGCVVWPCIFPCDGSRMSTKDCILGRWMGCLKRRRNNNCLV